jgi:Zn-dependent peptidase ImmA (M78 family)
MNSAEIRLPVNTLVWAAQTMSMSLGDVAAKISTKDKTREQVLQGIMTFPQVKKFAELTKKPLGFLFLETPPAKVQIELPDLRTRQQGAALSDDFLDIYKDILFKQEWYKDFLIKNNASELDFVGSYAVTSDAKEVAKNIREILNIGKQDSISSKDIDEYYDVLSKKAEDAGVVVFRNSVVKSNNHRPLNAEEFLGFAIADKFAPAIFINGADKTAAKNFTIAHELAHIWLGQGGVSDISIDAQNLIEKKCNQIASELLVPQIDFLSAWGSAVGDIKDKLTSLRNRFRVSELVIARIAKENGKITNTDYWTLYNNAVEVYKRLPKAEGGNGNAIARLHNSRKLTDTINSLLKVGGVSFKEAGLLLNKSPMKVGLN